MTALTSGAADALASLAAVRADLLSGVELPVRVGGPGDRGVDGRADRALPTLPTARPEAGAAPGDTAYGRGTPPAEPVYGRREGNDIQGNVVPGFNKDHQHFLFLRLGDVERARVWLRWLAPRLATMNEVLDFRREFRAARLRLGVREPGLQVGGLTATWTSVAFSHGAVAALAGQADADRFGDESFRQGLAARSTYLGDPSHPAGPGHRDHWVVGGPQNEADVLVTVAADVPDDLEAAVAEVVTTAGQHGLVLVHGERGDNLPGNLSGHEHFGFKDGISQPAVRGARSSVPGDEITPRLLADDDPHADLFARPGHPLVWPGQFLLGEPRQDPQDPRVPAAASSAFPEWARLGSYVVVRRLAQDVPAFWAWAAATGEQVGQSAVTVAARLVGRWPSGAPVARSPHGDDAALAGDELANNHFLYQDDTRPSSLVPIPGYAGDVHAPAAADVLARVCPHAAHIRKVNPRDSGTDFGAPADTLTRLMLRRGIPYGPPLAGVAEPDDDLVAAERGLVFVAFMASIEDQFEFVTRRWANAADLPNVGGHDPVIGQSDRPDAAPAGTGATASGRDRRRHVDWPATADNREDVRIAVERDFVTPTGGGYFFAPPISAVDGVLAGNV